MQDDGTADGVTHKPGSRRLAIASFLLTVTSLLLAWWRVTWTSAAQTVRDVRLFRPDEPLTTSWGPWLTGSLVVIVLTILFVRIAAKSDRHEPGSWRRDLGVAAWGLALALASCLLWPAGVPGFWGGRTLMNETITDGANATVETAMPGLGWWVAAVAVLLLLLARRAARRYGNSV